MSAIVDGDTKLVVGCVLLLFSHLLLCDTSFFPRDYILLQLFDQVTREQRCALERASAPVEQVEFYALYDSLVFWLYGRGIWYPPNVEFSVKFSQNVANNKRYVLELPVAVFAGQEKLLGDLLVFLSLPKMVRNFLERCYVMSAYSIIFALEFGEKVRQKVYVDYGYGMGMKSCEWRLDEPEVMAERSYNTIDDEAFVDSYAKSNLSGRRLEAYQKLGFYVERDRSLIKDKHGAKTLCIPFRLQVCVRDVLNYLTEIAPSTCVYLVAPCLASSENLIISWLHVARSEISCYTRLYHWYVAVDAWHPIF